MAIKTSAPRAIAERMRYWRRLSWSDSGGPVGMLVLLHQVVGTDLVLRDPLEVDLQEDGDDAATEATSDQADDDDLQADHGFLLGSGAPNRQVPRGPSSTDRNTQDPFAAMQSSRSFSSICSPALGPFVPCQMM